MGEPTTNTDIQIANLKEELANAYATIEELRAELRKYTGGDTETWTDERALELRDVYGWSLAKIAQHFGYSRNSATAVARKLMEARERCGTQL